MKQVTIDYDGTLTRPDVFEYVHNLIKMLDVDVWILTYRYDELHKHLWDGPEPNNEDLYQTIKELGLPKEKVLFTNMESKASYLAGTNVIFHLDDDERVMFDIKNSRIRTIGIQVNSGSWKNKCNRLLSITK